MTGTLKSEKAANDRASNGAVDPPTAFFYFVHHDADDKSQRDSTRDGRMNKEKEDSGFI